MSTAWPVLISLSPSDAYPHGIDPPAPADRDPGDLEEQLGVRQALERLSPRQRAVLYLRFYAGCTLRQVGAELHVSRSRVAQIQLTALAALRRQLTSIE